MKKTLLLVGGAIIAIVIIIGLLFMGSYNKFVTLSQRADEKWAQVQNVYQRRADLIPNLVSTVSGAANFEKSTLTEVVQARASVGQVQINQSQAPSQADLGKFQQAQDQLSSALSRLLVVVERYPELKANANFQTLQAQLEGSENRIAVERQAFNTAVREYNTAIAKVPGAMIAGLFRFQPKAYFQAAAGSENAPKVQFDFSKPAATNR